MPGLSEGSGERRPRQGTTPTTAAQAGRLRRVLRAEGGVAYLEYAVLAAVVALGVVAALGAFGGTTQGALATSACRLLMWLEQGSGSRCTQGVALAQAPEQRGPVPYQDQASQSVQRVSTPRGTRWDSTSIDEARRAEEDRHRYGAPVSDEEAAQLIGVPLGETATGEGYSAAPGVRLAGPMPAPGPEGGRSALLDHAVASALASDVYLNCNTETPGYCIEATTAHAVGAARRLLKAHHGDKRTRERQLTGGEREKLALAIRKHWQTPESGARRAQRRDATEGATRDLFTGLLVGDFAGCRNTACEVGAAVNAEVPIYGDALGVLAGTYHDGWSGAAWGAAGIVPFAGLLGRASRRADAPPDGRRGGTPKPRKGGGELDVDRIMAESGDISEKLDVEFGDALTNYVKRTFRRDGAPSDDSLLFHTTGNFEGVAESGLRKRGYSYVYFGHGKPRHGVGVTLVLPRHRFEELGGRLSSDGVGVLDGTAIPTGIPIEEFAIVHAVGHGMVVPLHIPDHWEGGVGNVLDMSDIL